jgi:hypothetical protein
MHRDTKADSNENPETLGVGVVVPVGEVTLKSSVIINDAK